MAISIRLPDDLNARLERLASPVTGVPDTPIWQPMP